jgi:lipid II:glycine glycyltransferase (peptidoglycan interpeptide bridge formation enzyme)
MGAYHLQWEMIKFAKAHHIDRYNFYGITGDFSESSEDYGVQQFKKGFNAHVPIYSSTCALNPFLNCCTP